MDGTTIHGDYLVLRIIECCLGDRDVRDHRLHGQASPGCAQTASWRPPNVTPKDWLTARSDGGREHVRWERGEEAAEGRARLLTGAVRSTRWR
jgi:hypothetical protein